MAEQEATVDVAVIGSGAAALAAAVAASDAGARVIVIERSDLIGGTSATSSGLVYAPGSSWQKAKGVEDSQDLVVQYVRAIASAPVDEELLRAYLSAAPNVIDFLGGKGVRFRGTGLADYYSGVAGASASRAVALEDFKASTLGVWAPRVRQSPYRALSDGKTWNGGTALIGYLLVACLEGGVDVRTGTRANRLTVANGAVTGLEATGGDGHQRIATTKGVILASGGFEHNEELLETYKLGHLDGAWSVAGNEGDALRMALDAGAILRGMGDAQWYPLLRLTDENREGRPFFVDAGPARQLPGSLMVDHSGHRFTNEGAMFQDVGRAVADAARPAWLIVDQRFINSYGERAFGSTPLNSKHWLVGDSIAEIAELAGIPAASLVATVRDFNVSAVHLEDPLFHRGETEFDQNWADTEFQGPRACLLPLEEGPFRATQVYAGCSGTTGGPAIDSMARVLSAEGPIEGLCAAGNVAPSVFAGCAPGSGSTLGPGMTFGCLAGWTLTKHV